MASSHANPDKAAIERELEAVYRLYAALAPRMDAEAGLGGKLLYAGEPDEAGGLLVRAANIAGAATLAASADAALLRGAMREGIVDFVVTSLDEALRILKNEIRKRQTVAVGVVSPPQAIAREMVERGVQPDLLAPALPHGPELDALVAKGARRIVAPPSAAAHLHILPIPAEWAQRTGALDALLLDAVPPEDFVNRRWVRLAPRYADRRARQMRLLARDVEPVLKRIERTGEASS
jgi:urocanate hydratase